MIQNAFLFHSMQQYIIYLNNYFPCLRHIKLWAIAINWQPYYSQLVKDPFQEQHSVQQRAQRYCTLPSTYLPTYLEATLFIHELVECLFFCRMLPSQATFGPWRSCLCLAGNSACAKVSIISTKGKIQLRIRPP